MKTVQLRRLMIIIINTLVESCCVGKVEGEGVSYEPQNHKDFIIPCCAFICLS